MALFARGNKLWIRFCDADGKWRNAPTGYDVGDESKAEEVLAEVTSRVETQRAASTVISGEGSSETVRKYAHRWLAKRQTSTVDDDRGRVDNHIVPALGDIPLAELRPRHVRDFVQTLGSKRTKGQYRKDGTLVGGDGLLSPRTINTSTRPFA
jgi:hypothetical protein